MLQLAMLCVLSSYCLPADVIHEQAVILYTQPGLEHDLDVELQHKEIIDRFGRYPHRNTMLGRESSDEECTFLLQPDSSF